MTKAVMDWSARKTEWINAVQALCGDISQWAREKKWTVTASEKIIHEHFGASAVPALMIEFPGGRLHVDPVAADVIAADGRVDLLHYPTLNSMLLVLHDGQWSLQTDSRVPWPVPWGPDCFYELADALGR